MTGLFITAIGTDCGKTHVACGLLRELFTRGKKPLALKPLMTGFDPLALEKSDAGRLLAACGRSWGTNDLADICWKSFAEPSAPNVAARRVGIDLDYRELLAFIRARTAAPTTPYLIEGVGGVMTPLTDDCTNIDLMTDLNLPVLMTAANYVGAVTHTLTALEVLLRRGLRTVGVVVSQPWQHAGPADVFADELRRWISAPVAVAPFASSPADDAAWAAPLAQRLFP